VKAAKLNTVLTSAAFGSGFGTKNIFRLPQPSVGYRSLLLPAETGPARALGVPRTGPTERSSPITRSPLRRQLWGEGGSRTTSSMSKSTCICRAMALPRRGGCNPFARQSTCSIRIVHTKYSNNRSIIRPLASPLARSRLTPRTRNGKRHPVLAGANLLEIMVA